MSPYLRTEYPRPHFARNQWLNLNGEWSFGFDDQNVGEKEGWFNKEGLNLKINVPFVYESKASGIGEEKFHPNVWYQRTVEIPTEEKGKSVYLRFQASDYITKVWVNGQFAGSHEGGNSAFSFDITNLISDTSNQITVKVEDSNSCYQPRGKQRWRDENYGCWYTQTTGIWQTVWLEFVEENHIQNVKITPDIDTNSVNFHYRVAGNVSGKNLQLKTSISFKGQLIKELTLAVDRSDLHVNMNLLSDTATWKIMLWHPNHPNLYDVKFTLYAEGEIYDEVESYFGMRKISIENGKVLLNNRPIYQRLILDQGYWPDTLQTPPSDEKILEDIDKIMEMGFNGVRKHQKLEDERFLYWCDRKGLLVWSEMAAAYEFSDKAVDQFMKEWLEIVQQHYNHPSIITWVPFNESWGVPNIYTDENQQKFTEAVYYLTKAFDSMRPVILNDGWEHTISDIITLHDYEEKGQVFYNRYVNKESILSNEIPHNRDKYAMAKGYTYKGQPVIISEYGGIALQNEKGWGYGNQARSEEDFFARYKSITDAIKQLDYVCGFCYTQVTDVQQEVNGLLTPDRKPKVDVNRVREINLG